MSDISGGYEQRALDSLDTVSKIERKIKQGYQITKKEFFIEYGYEPYFGVWDTAGLVDHLEKHWSKDKLIHHMLKEYTPRKRNILLQKVSEERKEIAA